MDTETLRPDAAGDETNFYIAQVPSEGEHWDKVDEEDADGDTTRVHIYRKGTTWYRDLYNIADSGIGAGTINHIKVYACCRRTLGTPDQTNLKIAIKSTNVHEGAEKTTTTEWALYSQQWDTNPDNAHAWTWDEIDALQIGIALRGHIEESFEYTYCTQVYVVVDYTLVVGWTGKISGVTNPAKIMGVDVANIKSVKGIE